MKNKEKRGGIRKSDTEGDSYKAVFCPFFHLFKLFKEDFNLLRGDLCARFVQALA